MLRSPILPDDWVPPHSEKAEQSLLGAMMVDNRAIDIVAGILSAEDFHYPSHERIYRACLDLRGEGRTADPVTLAPLADRDDDLKELGGARYLAELASGVVSVVNPKEYAELIADLARRRDAILACEEAARRMLDHNAMTSAGEIARETATLFEDLAERASPRQRQGTSIADTVEAFMQGVIDTANGRGREPVKTGIAALDDMLGGGFMAPDLVAIGGRPSMGKTALAETIAWNVSSGGRGVVFFSLEMSRDQLLAKAVQRCTGIPARSVLTGALNRRDQQMVVAARDDLRAAALDIIDDSALKPSDVRARVRRLQRRRSVALVIVDQLNLMQPDTTGRSFYETISGVVRAMQGVAKSLGVPLLLLCQLSRANTARDDKRPQLSDLRDTGAVEESARAVLFVHRPEYYLAREEPADPFYGEKWQDWRRKLDQSMGKAELILAKHHLAPAPATATVDFDKNHQRFGDQPAQAAML